MDASLWCTMLASLLILSWPVTHAAPNRRGDDVLHQWPSMVSLQSGSQSCGGTLISDQWVLTAAHCLMQKGWDPGVEVIRIGWHSQKGGEITLAVAAAIPHEDYDSWTMDKDVMLLKLVDKVDYDDMVNVWLPKQGSRVEVGTSCYAIGWGDDVALGSWIAAGNLLDVKGPILSEETCKRQNFNDKITDNMICAGHPEGGRDSCKGDSGDPLVCYTDGHWVQYGVFSRGNRCGKAKKPDVYAKVSNFVDWIEKVIKENS